MPVYDDSNFAPRIPRTEAASSAPTDSQNSVLFALGELAQLETARVAEERAREASRREQAQRETERLAAAQAAAARQQALEHERTRAVAEATARLRIEAELEQDVRMTALAAELRRVQADREAMQARVVQAHAMRVDAGTPSRLWPIAFGLSSLVAASLAALVVLQAGSEPQVVEIERPVIVEVPAPAPSSLPASLPNPEPVRAIRRLMVHPEATPAAEPTRPAPSSTAVRGTRTGRGTRRGEAAAARTQGDGLDFGESTDVIQDLERL